MPSAFTTCKMNTAEAIDFSTSIVEQQPFPHFCATSVFSAALERRLHAWLQTTENWTLTKTEFYEQFEFSLFDVTLPADLMCLVGDELLGAIRGQLEAVFASGALDLVGATIHKLTDGQRIGVHNDFIGAEESHRLIVQINANWREENGGYLLLFNSAQAEDISKVVLPVSNSAFGFEISPRSHHAVSTVYNFPRYTLVYTFKQQNR